MAFSLPDAPDFYERALCSGRGYDTNAWFPVDSRPDEDLGVFAICARCPVQVECLEFALDNNIVDGIWGGAGEQERRAMRREDRRARPEASHGTYSRYTAGCDCDDCRLAARQYKQRLRSGGGVTRQRPRIECREPSRDRYQRGCRCNGCTTASQR